MINALIAGSLVASGEVLLIMLICYLAFAEVVGGRLRQEYHRAALAVSLLLKPFSLVVGVYVPIVTLELDPFFFFLGCFVGLVVSLGVASKLLIDRSMFKIPAI